MIRRLLLAIVLASVAAPVLSQQTARIRPDQDPGNVEDVLSIEDSTYFVVQLIGDINPQSTSAAVIKAYVLAALTISDLSDMDTTGAIEGDLLQLSAGVWQDYTPYPLLSGSQPTCSGSTPGSELWYRDGDHSSALCFCDRSIPAWITMRGPKCD